MTISPPEKEQKVKVVVDNNPVPTSFEKWSQPGHFDRTLARGPKTGVVPERAIHAKSPPGWITGLWLPGLGWSSDSRSAAD